MAAPEFSTDTLLASLREIPDAGGYWVAFSGGLDSCVLLAAMHALAPRLEGTLRAVHVDHGLNRDAASWARFCEDECHVLAIPFHRITVDARPPPGQSPEAWARKLRYQAFERLLGDGEVLLTAHQQDDQAETLLLQLLRGAGPKGLAAMPRAARLGRGWLARPLLDVSRERLASFAADQGLRWIEDDSNRDPAFGRNFLRHEIVPLLKRRWPSVSATLARAAAWQADAAGLLDALARGDLQAVLAEHDGGLTVSALKRLDGPRRKQVFRAWLKQAGLSTPSASHLDGLSGDVVDASWDATPCVRWPEAEVRRYRDVIYAMRPLAPHDPRGVFVWDLTASLELPGGTLRSESSIGRGVQARSCEVSTVTVGFRHGGERCRPVGRSSSHSLKHLFQEAGIPPWRRDRIPLIYLDGELAAVAGLWVCRPFGAGPDERGLTFIWDPRV